MRIPWPKNRRERAAWGAVALAGGLAVSARWVEQWRPAPPDRSAALTLRVTNAQDAGAGSLRDAILAADRLQGRARVIVAVPRIVLETVLPPLVNPRGVVIETEAGAEIDGTRLAGPVLDVASPGTVVSGFHIAGGSAGVVVRAAGTTLRNISVGSSDTGVLIGDGADSVRIQDSSFADNRIGIQVTAPRGETTLQNLRFTNHRSAAVWAVATPSAIGPQIHIMDSRFFNDAIGLVAINVTSRVERNGFEQEGSAGVHASGGRAFINGNQIQAGRGFGIYAERLESGYISRNEMARNCNGGMLLRDVGNTQVVSNELYQNGYGVVVMEGPLATPNNVANNLIADQVADGLVLIGASPIVSRNQVVRNRKAGFRFSSLRVDSGTMRTPAPFLADNVVRDNGEDETQHDEYVAATAEVPSASADCAWRLGTPSLYPVRGTRER